MKYTEEDVIFWADDERLKDAIGKKCYMAKSPKWVLNKANDDFNCVTLDAIESENIYPFLHDGVYSSFIILKKEPEKKIVPFDFSLKEDRDALMGKRIKTNAEDMIVTAFAYWISKGWQIQVDSKNGFDGEYVFKNFVFADGENKGKPVGKEVIDGD